MEIQGKIKLLKSNQVDSSGVAVAPLASELEFGQIAVNYSALNPSLFFKDANGKVVKIVTEEVIADTLADILGGSAADLSTLKELLDAFATSDIATVQADVLKRLSAVETGKVDKVAGKGLSTNDYTNADKNKLASLDASYYARQDKFSQVKDLNTLFGESNGFYTVDGNLTNTPVVSPNMRIINMGVPTRATQIAFDWASDRAWFRRKQDSLIGNWRELYHAGNSNLLTTDWNCKRLRTSESIYQSRTDLGWMVNSMDNGDVSYFSGIYTSEARIGTSNNKNFQIYTNDAIRIHVSKDGNVGINQPTPTEKLDVNGNGLFSGNVTAKGDVVAYSATSNVRIEPVAGGASNLFDLGDVELPTTLTNNYVLAYDASKKKWTAKESVGTGGAKVDYDRLANVPTAFTPCAHNHNDIIYTSDNRLKENIKDITNATLIINSLTPKTFTWNETAKSFGLDDELSYGLIAQEVKKLLPELVKPLGKEDYIGVDYIKIVPILIKAVQEQHEEIIKLNKKLSDYEKKQNKAIATEHNNAREISELETRLTALEARF